MNGLNRIFLLGRLGHSPQLYSTKSGKTYAGLSVATNRYKANFAGDQEDSETTDWHFVRVWGTQAHTCAKYLSKGQPVLVEGYLTHYNSTNDTNNVEKKTGINAIRVEFLPRSQTTGETAEPET